MAEGVPRRGGMLFLPKALQDHHQAEAPLQQVCFCGGSRTMKLMRSAVLWRRFRVSCLFRWPPAFGEIWRFLVFFRSCRFVGIFGVTAYHTTVTLSRVRCGSLAGCGTAVLDWSCFSLSFLWLIGWPWNEHIRNDRGALRRV